MIWCPFSVFTPLPFFPSLVYTVRSFKEQFQFFVNKNEIASGIAGIVLTGFGTHCSYQPIPQHFTDVLKMEETVIVLQYEIRVLFFFFGEKKRLVCQLRSKVNSSHKKHFEMKKMIIMQELPGRPHSFFEKWVSTY